jgi:hypothetical protein
VERKQPAHRGGGNRPVAKAAKEAKEAKEVSHA